LPFCFDLVEFVVFRHRLHEYRILILFAYCKTKVAPKNITPPHEVIKTSAEAAFACIRSNFFVRCCGFWLCCTTSSKNQCRRLLFWFCAFNALLGWCAGCYKQSSILIYSQISILEVAVDPSYSIFFLEA
jgi:hypothetical protein